MCRVGLDHSLSLSFRMYPCVRNHQYAYVFIRFVFESNRDAISMLATLIVWLFFSCLVFWLAHAQHAIKSTISHTHKQRISTRSWIHTKRRWFTYTIVSSQPYQIHDKHTFHIVLVSKLFEWRRKYALQFPTHFVYSFYFNTHDWG